MAQSNSKKDLLKFVLFVSVMCILFWLLFDWLVVYGGDPRRNNDSIYDTTNHMKTGEVWVIYGDTANPYEKSTNDTLHIIDYKKRYIKYILNGDTFSRRERWIKDIAVKIK